MMQSTASGKILKYIRFGKNRNKAGSEDGYWAVPVFSVVW